MSSTNNEDDGKTRAESQGTRAESQGTRAESSQLGNSTGSNYRRLQLPQPILDRYDYLRDLNTGGAQADIAVCRSKDTGQEVVVKLYRVHADRIDLGTLNQLVGTDPDHVVPLVESPQVWEGLLWEIQEYFPLGTLSDVMADHRLGASSAREILDELYRALVHIHDLQIVHRDLKPQNVFVRGLSPVDCVIGDFGLATELALSQDIRSVAGTWAYLSPEAIGGGTLTFSSDWWALGIIMYEVLHGHHLFSIEDGTKMRPDNQIRNLLYEKNYVIESTGDDRWDLLLRGLLTHDFQKRWGADQIKRWLDGESPEVHVDPLAPVAEVRPFPFAGASYTDPAELGVAMRTEWRDAGELLAGRKAEELRAWLLQTSIGDRVEHVFAGGVSPDPALIHLQMILAPNVAPVFKGRSLELPSLNEVVEAAKGGDEAAVAWITDLRSNRILSAWAAAGRVTETVRLADDLLQSWWRSADKGLRSIPSGTPFADVARPALEWMLLTAALDPKRRDEIEAAGKRAAEADYVDLPNWARTLKSSTTTASGTGALGAFALAELVLPLAASAETARLTGIREREEAERREIEDRRREEERQRLARLRAQRFQRARSRFVLFMVLASFFGGVPSYLAHESIATAIISAVLVALALSLPTLLFEAPTARIGWGVGIIVFAWLVWDLILNVAWMVINGADPVRYSYVFWSSLVWMVPIAYWAVVLINLAADHLITERRQGARRRGFLTTVGTGFGVAGVGMLLANGILTIAGMESGGISTDELIADLPPWVQDIQYWFMDNLGPIATALPISLERFSVSATSILFMVMLFGSNDLRQIDDRVATVGWILVVVLGLIALLTNLALATAAIFLALMFTAGIAVVGIGLALVFTMMANS
jgi:hypothetical protein